MKNQLSAVGHELSAVATLRADGRRLGKGQPCRTSAIFEVEQYDALIANLLEIKRMLNDLLKRVQREGRPLAPAVEQVAAP